MTGGGKSLLHAITAQAVCAAQAVSQNQLGSSSKGTSGTWGIVWKDDWVDSGAECSARGCDEACVNAGWTGVLDAIEINADDHQYNKDTTSMTYFGFKNRHCNTCCNERFCCCYE
jgi:hypothetical protein